MLSKDELIKSVIEATEKELGVLNDFAENEGHPNSQVILAICTRIGFLERDLEHLKDIAGGKKEDYEFVWETFWKGICAPSGVVEMTQIKKELADYKVLLGEVPKVYDELAGFSKPHTRATVIIDSVNDRMIDKQTAFDDLAMTAENGEVILSLDFLKEYFNIR